MCCARAFFNTFFKIAKTVGRETPPYVFTLATVLRFSLAEVLFNFVFFFYSGEQSANLIKICKSLCGILIKC